MRMSEDAERAPNRAEWEERTQALVSHGLRLYRHAASRGDSGEALRCLEIMRRIEFLGLARQEKLRELETEEALSEAENRRLLALFGRAPKL